MREIGVDFCCSNKTYSRITSVCKKSESNKKISNTITDYRLVNEELLKDMHMKRIKRK